MASTSPITQVKSEQLEFRGITRVEDLLNDLPQIYSSNTSNESNGATGTATVDLRGLTPARTLVLANGHRMGFGDVFELAPDINQIPASLIERVDVLTGGASSTYGSDAVAGVVNFIMKRDFEGVQVDYQYSAYQHNQGNNDVQDAIDARGFEQADNSVWDGDTHDVNIIVGVNSPDGRGNITGYLGYREVDPVFQGDRDFSACALGGSQTISCGGSATKPEGFFAPFDGYAYYTVSGTNFVPWDGVLYNYAPLNYFQRPDERYTAGLFGHYEVNEHLEPYVEFMFMDDRSLAQIAPSGAFFVTSSLSCDNPFLSAQQTATINGIDNYPNLAAGGLDFANPGADGNPDYPCVPGNGDVVPWYIGRRNVEGGARFDDLSHTTYRILVGAKGDINADWSYDTFANFSRAKRDQVYNNDLSTTRIIRALNVTTVGGTPTCQSVVDGSDPACVPWNIFQTGGPTPAALSYLTLPLFSKATITQDQYVGFVTGDLTSMGLVSPAAHEGVRIVLGGEYRDEQMDFNPDNGFRTGDGAGQGGPIAPVNGQTDVVEFFTELRVPLVQDREWMESLTAEFGYRYSDYSTGVDTDTYKAGGEWTPVSGFKFRGGYSRAVRAPNLNDLFLPQSLGLFAGSDPCSTANPTATLAQCANSGVTAAQYGTIPASPAQQYNVLSGGNPTLDPEKSNSFTIGAVYQPDFIPGFQISVDYWNIEVKNAIDTVSPQLIVDTCVQTGDPTFCSQIQRGPNGNLWIGTTAFVTSTSINVATIETSGIDILANYGMEVGNYGNVDFSFVGSWLEAFDYTALPDTPASKCQGQWNGVCGNPYPEWKHNFNAAWTTPWNITFAGTWRHVGGVDDFLNGDGGFKAKAQNYLDLAAVYTPTFINFGETRLTVGVSNVTDNDPPVSGFFNQVSVFGNGNTIPGTYDALGRYFFFGVTQSF